jgi:hypothetical protein
LITTISPPPAVSVLLFSVGCRNIVSPRRWAHVVVESHGQQFSRSVDPRLDGLGRNPEDAAGFQLRIALERCQQQGFLQGRGQLADDGVEPTRQLLVSHNGVGGIGRISNDHGLVVEPRGAKEQPPHGITAAPVSRLVKSDGLQPGQERPTGVVPIQRLPGRNERLVDRLIGFVGVTGVAPQEPI